MVGASHHRAQFTRDEARDILAGCGLAVGETWENVGDGALIALRAACDKRGFKKGRADKKRCTLHAFFDYLQRRAIQART